MKSTKVRLYICTKLNERIAIFSLMPNEKLSRSVAIGWIDFVMHSYGNIALYPKQSVPLQNGIINLET
jgi:hypothetical protein